jgi:branched-chain amino acid aminotransferase
MQQRFDERNRNLVVNVAGRLVHRDEAGVSPFDSVVQGGDAVWEGLRLYSGRIFRLEQHLDRLVESARALAFHTIPSRAEITGQIRRTLEANAMFDGVHVRLTLTRGVKITSGMDPRLNTSGPTLIVLAEHKPPVYPRDGISLVTASTRRFPPDCLDPKIHHNNLIQSILAKIEANFAGADDALMLDMRGFVAETNATHLFIVDRGLVRTPRTVACPGGNHARGRARALRRERHCARGLRPFADRGLPRARDVLHRNHGRACGRDAGRRPDHRRRQARHGDRAVGGSLPRAGCARGNASCVRPVGGRRLKRAAGRWPPRDAQGPAGEPIRISSSSSSRRGHDGCHGKLLPHTAQQA